MIRNTHIIKIGYTYRMKSHTEYVRDEFVAEVSEQIKNYKRFKRLTNRWVDLAIKYAKLKMKNKVKKSLINSRELGTLKNGKAIRISKLTTTHKTCFNSFMVYLLEMIEFLYKQTGTGFAYC